MVEKIEVLNRAVIHSNKAVNFEPVILIENSHLYKSVIIICLYLAQISGIILEIIDRE